MTEMRISTTGPTTWHPEIIIEAARGAVRRVEPVLRAAGGEQAARTRGLIHNQSGQLGGSVKARLRRLGTGYVLTIGPTKGKMHIRGGGTRRRESKYDLFYGYFVERGTGTAGPLGRPIADDDRGLVPNGAEFRRPSGRGQKPQRPFGRARDEYDQRYALQVDRQVQGILDEEIHRASLRALR